MGKGLPSLVISVFRYAVIIIPVAFILSRIYEVNGVWWSFGVTELVTAFISYIIYKKGDTSSLNVIRHIRYLMKQHVINTDLR